MKIFSATVTTKGGPQTYLSSSEDGVYEALYLFVKGEWDGVFSSTPLPEDHREAVHYYFNNCQLNVTDIKAKLHCIVIDDPDAGNGPNDGYRVFLGQTREEALEKAYNYMAENLDEELGRGDIGAMSPEKKLRTLKHVYGSPFDGEVEV